MSQPKFTPGPWKSIQYEMFEQDAGWLIVGPDDQTIAAEGVDAQPNDSDLIKASPDLYAACKAYLDFRDNPPIGPIAEGTKRARSIMKLMEDAVAKADGRTPEEPSKP